MKRQVWIWFDGRWLDEGTTVMGSATAKADSYADLHAGSPGRFDVGAGARAGLSTARGKTNLYVRV